ncbi:hypothetical protein SeMB42_g06402 [Synchytrium endobioticum]|uniref:Uncharacterized protein n=1 Tax=Synchytrium endobioticum TaxID=286115 RepID=A0A507CRY1_9FUNG|nr:hypothetical protein SeMB42_g06402 [Synchytrium endobioticum]TPX41914.1 hypothetical protein SeLEV6574_g05864 [Synchytrium endobioticum]
MAATTRNPCVWVLGISIFAAVVLTLALLNMREGDRLANNMAGLLVDENGDVSPSFSGVFVQASVISVDPMGQSCKIHFSFSPQGKIVDPQSAPASSSIPLRVSIGDNSVNNFASHLPMNSIDLSLPFESGNENGYPFDKYTMRLGVVATSFDTTTNASTPVPIAFMASGAIQAFRLSFAIHTETYQAGPSNITSPVLALEVVRSYTTKLYSVFVAIIMWLLALSIFTLSFSLWIRGIKADLPAVGVATSMLFALPAIRNAQPGAPPIGCTSDVMSFFWSMFLVSVSALLLVWNHISFNQNGLRPPSVEAPSQPKESAQRQAMPAVPLDHSVILMKELKGLSKTLEQLSSEDGDASAE